MQAAATSRTVSRPSLLKKLIKYRHTYILLFPFMLVFTVFTIWPVVLSLFISFTNFNVFESPSFVGWNNYVNLFVNDEVFGIALKNTLVFAVLTGPLGYLLSMFFAWVINEMPRGLREFMTLVFYAPTMAGAGLFTIWGIVFDADIYGYLNSFLLRFGFINEPIGWMVDPQYMMLVVVVVQLWLSMGTSFLTLRAGFSTIDRQLYEAGLVDGVRNRWQELWYITLPAMAPHLMLSAILAITAAFSTETVATAMTGFPSTDYATHTLMHHMRDYGFLRYQRGYACAVSTIIFALSFGTNMLVQRLIRRVGK